MVVVVVCVCVVPVVVSVCCVMWFVYGVGVVVLVLRVLLCVRGVCLLFRCYVEFERDAFRVCVFVRVCL